MPDDFAALMEALKGGITAEEAALLRRLAARVGSGCIVEVGSYRGKSAVALALGVRENRHSVRPRIYCIEPHRDFTGFYGGRFGPEDRGAFYAVMTKTGAFNEVALVNLSSEDVAAAWTQPVGLAFIDGDHHYEQVLRDFRCWDRHVVLGGLVAFDDALDPACGPARVVREILESRRYREVERVGKILVLQKLQHDAPVVSTRPQRILVACHDIIWSGGLLRFERVGRELARWGHELAFVRFSETPAPERDTDLAVLSMAQAAAAQWDAVMVPGAGFPSETIERFAELRAPNFGVRVQHVLNDRTVHAGFKRVNAAFAPDVVIFNNPDWPVGSFTDFQARRFHVLVGAVDTAAFRPPAYRTHPLEAGRWIVGGQAAKNADVLIEALDHLPPDVTLRLYGPDRQNLAELHADLVAAGRLQLSGPITEHDLPRYYHGVDCVVMCESHAGWANLAAEALASATPLVCTRHGTAAFARHEDTALVVDEPLAEPIAAAIERLRSDAALCRQLAERGREAIAQFGWGDYSRRLLQLIAPDDAEHYVHLPEAGLYGKWPAEDRLAGLAPLIENARGKSIIDFGCAEGIVAREFLRHGASLLHGFERDPFRVGVAAALCADFDQAVFREADLSDLPVFRAEQADLLRAKYDIVLYLGIHHHIDADAREALLCFAIDRAQDWFAIRTPAANAEADRIDERLARAGFERVEQETRTAQSANLGNLMLYRARRT
ncbi:MAG: class I SAM-dependent methyltransferase [Rhodanobacteraceae bacterium]